jgi:hypothetical protein
MHDTVAVVTVPLLLAGVLTLAGAALHGIGGELLVLRRLAADGLPGSRFGGPRMTRTMLHVAWHLATVAFVTVGVALVVAGTALEGDARQALAVVCAIAATGFAAVTLVLGGTALSLRGFVRHPAPALLTVTAALAWWGAV